MSRRQSGQCQSPGRQFGVPGFHTSSAQAHVRPCVSRSPRSSPSPVGSITDRYWFPTAPGPGRERVGAVRRGVGKGGPEAQHLLEVAGRADRQQPRVVRREQRFRPRSGRRPCLLRTEGHGVRVRPQSRKAGLQLEIRDFANLTRWRWLHLNEPTCALSLITRYGSTRTTGSSRRSAT